jgi:CRISPR-associated endonuclease Csn1
MLAMIGKCTFEKDEYRAPKHSWSAERFVWLTKLNNCRISENGNVRSLTADERNACIDLPYELSKVEYKQLKAKMVKSGFWSEEVKFVGLNYRDENKNPENATLMELKSWHELRKRLEAAQLKTEWQGIATQPELLDQIGVVLSIYKSDDEIRQQLSKLRLQNPVIEALLSVSFNDFIRLSIKALNQILPGMERGLRYDQACDEACYVHSKPNKSLNDEDKLSLLPSFYVGRNASGKMLRDNDQDLPNNPVVLRSLNQARLITNAIIRKYGSPMAVHIEMARDLSRPLDERQKIKKEQEVFRDRNKKNRDRFSGHFGRRPTAREFEKWQFYQEQQGKCAYSLEPIDLNRLISDSTYTEVDHALPYSRSFDDSKNNKVGEVQINGHHVATF